MSFHEQFNTEKTNILFLDTSSSCTGYAIAECDWKKRTATISAVGALWLHPKWHHGKKYHYMQKSLEVFFYIVEKIDYMVHEMYSVNPKAMMGVMVVPELIGSLKAACEEIGINSEAILPQTWRKHCEIKAVKDEAGKRDYKAPTKEKILSMTNIPETIISNITGKERTTPSDVYDAAGIAYGWLKKLEGYDDTFFKTVKFSKELRINPHVGYDLDGDL